MNTRELARFVRKMRFQDGDVLFIKEGTSLATKETIDSFIEYFKTRTRSIDILFVVVDEFGSIDKIDHNAMNAHGWYRKDDLVKLMVKSRQSRPVPEASYDKQK